MLTADAVREAVDSLEQDGYCILRAAIPPALVTAARAGFAEWTAEHAAQCAEQRAQFDGFLPRIINLHQEVPALARLFSETPAVLAVLDAQLGAEAVLYTTIYFEHGSAQAVHRDAPYFATQPQQVDRFVGVWYALEDTTEQNGPLTVVRGGHNVFVDRVAVAKTLFPDLSQVPRIDQKLWETYQEAVAERCVAAGLPTVTLHARAGDVILWHAMLPHGGMPIDDSRPTRHSMVVHSIPIATTVHQADVFFNPEHTIVPNAVEYDTITNGRRMIRHAGPYFGVRRSKPTVSHH
jgi:ectoine hydroxylase-related dioxygenase (phytanoyl-CoA dioxygenase family)